MKKVKPFTTKEILMNYQRLLGRTDFNEYFQRKHRDQAEVIDEMLKNNQGKRLYSGKDTKK